MKSPQIRIKGPLQQILFWVFLIFSLTLVVLSLYVDGLFFRYRAIHLPPVAMQAKVQATLTLVRTSLPDQYPYIVSLLRQRGMRVDINNQPRPNGLQVTGDQSVIEAITTLKQYPNTSKVSIELATGKWLVMRVSSKTPQWVVVSRIVAGSVLVCLLFLLCYFVIFSFTVPLRLIASATDRLAVDWEAPRLAPVGSAAMRALIRSFNAMQQRIQKIVRDRSQMLAAISHDLRTPITRLQLRAEFIEDKKQYEKTIEDLSDMERMIASILSFCKNYEETEAKASLDLTALVESVVDDFQAMGKPVHMDESDCRIFFFGRISALRRAVCNLIENALKYGNRASVELEEKDKHNWCLSITDSGPGIAESDIERVFEPFYRCDTARSLTIVGSGLGLAVVKEIIESHRGRISLINLPEGGLRVEVILPKDESTQ